MKKSDVVLMIGCLTACTSHAVTQTDAEQALQCVAMTEQLFMYSFMPSDQAQINRDVIKQLATFSATKLGTIKFLEMSQAEQTALSNRSFSYFKQAAGEYDPKMPYELATQYAARYKEDYLISQIKTCERLFKTLLYQQKSAVVAKFERTQEGRLFGYMIDHQLKNRYAVVKADKPIQVLKAAMPYDCNWLGRSREQKTIALAKRSDNVVERDIYLQIQKDLTAIYKHAVGQQAPQGEMLVVRLKIDRSGVVSDVQILLSLIAQPEYEQQVIRRFQELRFSQGDYEHWEGVYKSSFSPDSAREF